MATKKPKNPAEAPLQRIRRKIDQSIAESQRLEIESTLLDNPGDTSLERKVRSITENAKKIAERQRYSEEGLKAVSAITKIVENVDPQNVDYGVAQTVIDQLEDYKVQSRKLFNLESGERTKMLAEIRQIQNGLRGSVTRGSVAKNVATKGIQDVVSRSFDFTGLIKDFVGGNKVVDAMIDYGAKIYKDSKDSKTKREKIENEMSQRVLAMARDRLKKTEEEMSKSNAQNAPTEPSFSVGDDAEISAEPAKKKKGKSNKQELVDSIKQGIKDGIQEEAAREGVNEEDTQKIVNSVEQMFESEGFKKLIDETVKNGVVSEETRDLLDKFIREQSLSQDRAMEDIIENKRARRASPGAASVVNGIAGAAGAGGKKGSGGGFLDTVSNIAETVSGLADLRKLLAGGALAGAIKAVIDGAKNMGLLTKAKDLFSKLPSAKNLVKGIPGMLRGGASAAGNVLRAGGGILARALPSVLTAGGAAGAASVAGVGAAGLAGYQFGSFVNDKLGISDRIVEGAARMTGIDNPQRKAKFNPRKTPSNPVASAIANASKTVGIDQSTMLALAKQESGFDPNAQAGTSTASGLYQFLDGTWNDIVKRYGAQYPVLKKGKLDPEASALAGALYAKENQMILEKAKIPVNASSLYAMHFLGPTDAKKMLKMNPSVEAARNFPKAARSNPSVFYGKNRKPKTVGEVREQLFGHVGRSSEEFRQNGNKISGSPVDSGILAFAPQVSEPSISSSPMMTAEAPAQSSSVPEPVITAEAPEPPSAPEGLSAGLSGSVGMPAMAAGFGGLPSIPGAERLESLAGIIPGGNKIQGIVASNVNKAMQKTRIGKISDKFGEYSSKASQIKAIIPPQIPLPQIPGMLGASGNAGMASPSPMLDREDPTFLRLSMNNMMTVLM